MTLRTANPHALNGAQLKVIAMVTMLIDHMAVVFLEQLYPYVVDMAVFDTQTIVYITMRLIGRLAFPIFAYLLVVGFYHTKNIKKYAFRLGVFALISELPFDYAMLGRWNWGYQNIFFTLLIGLLMLYLVDNGQSRWLKGLYFLLACAVAHFLQVDYGFFGVIVIGMMALVRHNPNGYTVPTAVILLYQFTAPLALIPIRQYDGTRGRQNKWLMYAFYPVHLAVLYLIARTVL